MATTTAPVATALVETGGDRSLIGAASLAIGPLVMAIGDLLHPTETAEVSDQVSIVVAHATRWYLAHLLLLAGLVLAVPGLLTLSEIAAARGPRVGYAARLLLMVGAAGVSAVFVAEMLAGRLASTAGAAATEDLLDVMFSGPIAGPMTPIMLSLFVGTAVLAVPLIADGPPIRWPAAALLVGTLLIMAEIISSQVLLSQIGNVMVWGASAAFAWLLIRTPR